MIIINNKDRFAAQGNLSKVDERLSAIGSLFYRQRARENGEYEILTPLHLREAPLFEISNVIIP
jgi:hypothetical protein